MNSNYYDKCPKCGMSREEFLSEGRFGCSECYDVFAWEARELLLRVQGCAVHREKADMTDDSTSGFENRSIERDLSSLFDEEYSELFVRPDDDGTAETQSDFAEEKEQEDAAEDLQDDESEGDTVFTEESDEQQAQTGVTDSGFDMKRFVELSNSLEKAVRSEDFETAARIRDELKSISSSRKETEKGEE